MARQLEMKLVSVSRLGGTKQAGEVRRRWPWAEPNVWTDRMLTALEKGVKGGKWFSLTDKVCSMSNMSAAFRKVKSRHGGAGVDNQTIEMFEKELAGNLERLHELLRSGRYQPRANRRKWIPKPGGRGKRPLGIPTVRDRVVQTALRHVLEPIFEKDFAEHSYGFRPGRGCKDVLRRVEGLLKSGCHYVVDADLKSYFDTIPHDKLLERVKAKVSDGKVLGLIGAYLCQEVMETSKGWKPESGTPQGAVISPLLSNIYLDPLDHLMSDLGIEMVRYADDFVALCRSEAEAGAALERIKAWTDRAGLTLHAEKTRIVDAAEPGGFDFLGYHFERGYKWPCDKSIKKFRDAIRGKTKRTNGHSLETIIADVNRMVRGWFVYYQHSNKHTFPMLDKWMRMRLRSILRKRNHLKGRGRGLDHFRWPNAYFAEHGLYSLTAAHAAACQPSRR